jgi:hypothetical protein
VTAKHVIFPPPDHKLPDSELEILSYSKDISIKKRLILNSTLQLLNSNGNIKAHQTRDVAVIKIATVVTNSPDGISSRQINFVPGIDVKRSAESELVGVARENVKTYDQVLVGNDVIMYGYPRSLTVPTSDQQLDQQLDPLRPLLRRGLIAGLNEKKRTIILDCPVYRGNSGGPAVEIEPEGLGEKLLVIGVVTEFVPLVEGSEDFLVRFNGTYPVDIPNHMMVECLIVERHPTWQTKNSIFATLFSTMTTRRASTWKPCCGQMAPFVRIAA